MAESTSSSSNLEKLISDFEYENKQYLREITQEQQHMQELELKIKEIDKGTGTQQDDVRKLDQNIKAQHTQFTYNRDNICSLKGTLEVLTSQEDTLQKALNDMKKTYQLEQEQREKLLNYYRITFEENVKQCKKLPLAQELQAVMEKNNSIKSKVDELKESNSHLKCQIRNMEEAFVPYTNLNEFVVKFATLGLEVVNLEKQSSEKQQKCSTLNKIINDKMAMKKQAEQEEVRKEEEAKRLMAEKKKEEEKRMLSAQEHVPMNISPDVSNLSRTSSQGLSQAVDFMQIPNSRAALTTSQVPPIPGINSGQPHHSNQTTPPFTSQLATTDFLRSPSVTGIGRSYNPSLGLTTGASLVPRPVYPTSSSFSQPSRFLNSPALSQHSPYVKEMGEFQQSRTNFKSYTSSENIPRPPLLTTSWNASSRGIVTSTMALPQLSIPALAMPLYRQQPPAAPRIPAVHQLAAAVNSKLSGPIPLIPPVYQSPRVPVSPQVPTISTPAPCSPMTPHFTPASSTLLPPPSPARPTSTASVNPDRPSLPQTPRYTPSSQMEHSQIAGASPTMSSGWKTPNADHSPAGSMQGASSPFDLEKQLEKIKMLQSKSPGMDFTFEGRPMFRQQAGQTNKTEEDTTLSDPDSEQFSAAFQPVYYRGPSSNQTPKTPATSQQGSPPSFVNTAAQAKTPSNDFNFEMKTTTPAGSFFSFGGEEGKTNTPGSSSLFGSPDTDLSKPCTAKDKTNTSDSFSFNFDALSSSANSEGGGFFSMFGDTSEKSEDTGSSGFKLF